MKYLLIGVLVVLVCIALAFHLKQCRLKCAHTIEGMSGGLTTTTGLSFYNKGRFCSQGNLLGSSSPYCESPGYVLF
jgi:hypothetical protein